MKEVYKRRKCPPRCPKSFRCDRKTKKNNKTRRCNPFSKTSLSKKLKKNVSVKKSPSPKMSRYAKFYNIEDKVELSRDEEMDLSSKQKREKFAKNITSELNSSTKYKIGDILFIGDETSPFAIVDEKNGKLTFALNDYPENLPFGSMLAKVTANHIKYQKIFESELGNLRELFISDEAAIDEYKRVGIY